MKIPEALNSQGLRIWGWLCIAIFWAWLLIATLIAAWHHWFQKPADVQPFTLLELLAFGLFGVLSLAWYLAPIFVIGSLVILVYSFLSNRLKEWRRTRGIQ